MTSSLYLDQHSRTCRHLAALLAPFLLAQLWLALPAGADPICLRVEREKGPAIAVQVSVGKEAHLSFRHSIYGSQVEEQFRITRDGLEIVRLRYSEARLVEFYGHEAARLEEGWWVVEGDHRVVPALYLRVSPDSFARISSGFETIGLSRLVEPGALVRLTVASCEGMDDGR